MNLGAASEAGIRPLTLAFFRHVKDARVRRHDTTWDELAAILTEHQERDEKDGPLWSPTLYRANTARGKSNVESICCLVLDFDKGVDPATMTPRWERWAYALYTTFSHSPEYPKWRVVFPFLTPIAGADWPNAWPQFARTFGGDAADPACKDASRIYFLPSCPPGAVRQAFRHDGEWIDPALILRPSAAYLVGRAKTELSAGRNLAGMWLACQMRDNGYTERETEALAWHKEVPTEKRLPNGTVDLYTETEWYETVRKAFSRGKREAWKPLATPTNGRHYTDEEAPPVERADHEEPIEADGDEDDTEDTEDTEKAARGPSEQTLARHFAADRAQCLMYMDGDQWFFYRSSGAWERRNYEHVERLAYDWMIAYQKQSDKKISITARKISSVVRLAKNELGPHGVDEIDSRVDCIPLKNGVYELSTDRLLPHLPSNRIGHILPYDYDARAGCTRWLQFLSEALVEEDGRTPCTPWHDLMQEFAGYLLIPTSRAQTSMFWQGSGANGKGVAQKVFENLVGARQVASILLSELHQPYHLAYLHGKLLASISEIDRQAMRKNGQILKQIIGGDMISGRRPGENFFDYPPTVRVVLTCNEMPRTDDQSEGYFRRIINLAFRRHFTEEERDPFLVDKLRAEASGIFNWALIGLRRLQARDFRFEVPEASRRLLAAYRTSEDNFKRFTDECCDVEPNGGMHTKPFYEAYTRYCVEEGEKDRILRLQDVRRRLEQMGCKQGRPYVSDLQQRGFFGITLKTDDWTPKVS